MSKEGFHLLLEEHSYNKHRNHRHQNLGDIVFLGVPFQRGERTAKEFRHLVPQDDQRGKYGGGMHHDGKREVLLTCRAQQRLTYLKVSGRRYGQKLGQSLNDTEYKGLPPTHFFLPFHKIATTIQTKPNNEIIGPTVIRRTEKMSGL